MKKGYRWRNVEKAELLIRLGSLLKRGYTISEALSLYISFQDDRHKHLLLLMLEQLKKGNSVSEVLLLLNIPKHVVSFVYFSEHYGNLAKGLLDGGEMLKLAESNRRKIRKLINYPLFLMWLVALFIFIIYHQLFPQFTLLFSTMELQLPLVTRVMVTLIAQFPLFSLFFLFFFLFLLLYYWLIFHKMDSVSKTNKLCRLPFFSRFYKMLLTYYFSSNLSCLLKGGLAASDALLVVKKATSFGYISEIAEKIASKLEEGEQLQQVLVNETVFLPELANIVEHGQVNGRLGDELAYYSSWLIGEFEDQVKKLFFTIQPLLFLLIGTIILILFASILLPVYSLITEL